MTVKIWNIRNFNWTLIKTYTNHTNFVYALEYINEDTIASGAYDRTIQIWSMSADLRHVLINTDSEVTSLALLNNVNYLAGGLKNSNIQIYDINNGNLTMTLSGHRDTVNDLALIRNENLLASSSYDTTIIIWDLNTYTNKFALIGHKNPVFGLKLISSTVLASGSVDNTIKLWDLNKGQLVRTLANHTNYVYYSIDVLSDGQTIVSGSFDQTIKFWNWTTGQLLNTFNTSLDICSLFVVNA